MFTWVGKTIDTVLDSYVLGVVSTLMTHLQPVALTAMSIWVLLYGWAVLRNEVSETVPVFLWKVVKLSLILAFALQSGVYISHVADTANAMAMGVASTFVPSGADPMVTTGPYALLDEFNDDASNQTADIMKEASLFRLDLVLAGIVFSFGSVIYLSIALFVITLAKLFLTFVIAIGPLFILCLAWRPTARFFDSWLSLMLNAVVLTWFAFFSLGLSTYMGAAMFQAYSDGGGFLGSTFNVLGEATRYCVLMILMAILCFQAPSLASALTGGPAVQQGIQMIQNALMVSGLRSSSKGAAARAGGVIRAGAGLPYAAGAATGGAGRQALSMGRHGYQVGRAAAYRLAALRGQS